MYNNVYYTRNNYFIPGNILYELAISKSSRGVGLVA